MSQFATGTGHVQGNAAQYPKANAASESSSETDCEDSLFKGKGMFAIVSAPNLISEHH
jgi:hypothetical protein